MNFTENVDNIIEIVEDIAELSMNIEDRDITDVNGEYIVSPIDSYLTADPNSPETDNMKANSMY